MNAKVIEYVHISNSIVLTKSFQVILSTLALDEKICELFIGVVI